MKKKDGEFFYTFLKPKFFETSDHKYYVFGYRVVDGEVKSFSATYSLDDPWTNAEAFLDKDLIEEFKKVLN